MTDHSSLITRKYEAVFLDAQGTLLKAHPSTAGIYAAVGRRCGVAVEEAAVSAAVDDLWAEHRVAMQSLEPVFDTSDQLTRRWWEAFNTRVFRRLGMEEDPAAFLEGLWEIFGRPESWRLFPEVEKVLVELRRRGYILGIVSNWDSRLVPICESLGIARHLDFILASASAGIEKPDPRIFRAALARAGVSADRALHVGDDHEADVLGARGAGLDALLIQRDGTTPRTEPTLHSLEELLRLLP